MGHSTICLCAFCLWITGMFCAAKPCPCSFGFETGSYSEEFTTDSSPDGSSGEEGGEGRADAPGEDPQIESEDAAVLQLATAGSLLVGFTATPVRLDGKSLGVVFQVGVDVCS